MGHVTPSYLTDPGRIRFHDVVADPDVTEAPAGAAIVPPPTSGTESTARGSWGRRRIVDGNTIEPGAGAVVPVLLAAVCVGAVATGSPSRWTPAAAVCASLVAAALSARTATRPVPPHVAPVAAALAGAAVVAGAAGPAWLPVTVAAPGLAAMAAVDLAESRVPTRPARVTAVLSAGALVAQAAHTGRWSLLPAAGAATATVVAVVAALWLAGGVGFGDVRLAAATASAGIGGAAYVGAMLVVPMVVLAGAGVVRRARRRRGPVPFGPAIVTGWLAAVWALA
jgi:leader peptidase (prepilin peptidase)/N-methyltransferase